MALFTSYRSQYTLLFELCTALHVYALVTDHSQRKHESTFSVTSPTKKQSLGSIFFYGLHAFYNLLHEL